MTMTGHAELLREIEKLPPKYFGEVLDFVGHLRQKAEKQQDDEITAYQAMAADTEREQEAREWCNAYFGPVLK
jgi:Zn-dependent oligopeptidase